MAIQHILTKQNEDTDALDDQNSVPVRYGPFRALALAQCMKSNNI